MDKSDNLRKLEIFSLIIFLQNYSLKFVSA